MHLPNIPSLFFSGSCLRTCAVCLGSESTDSSLQDVCVLLVPVFNKDITGLMSFLLLQGLQDVPCPSQRCSLTHSGTQSQTVPSNVDGLLGPLMASYGCGKAALIISFPLSPFSVFNQRQFCWWTF